MFVIYDTIDKSPYIMVQWPSKEIAESERYTVLKGFPDDHPWRKRLVVTPVTPEIIAHLERHANTKTGHYDHRKSKKKSN